MTIAIVEDEKYWQNEIFKRIASYDGLDAEICYYDSGEAFLKKPDCFDVVFMDVELGGEDGLGVSQKYRTQFPESILIILTTHTELCSKGYLVEAFRYIDKLHLEEIQEALESAAAKLIRKRRVTFHVVSAGDVNILCREIRYIETSGRNLAVHTTQGVYECTGNISALAEKLNCLGFFYIHRSYLVNVEEVFSFSRKEVTLKNKQTLDMSSHRYSSFKAFFFAWKLERGNG